MKQQTCGRQIKSEDQKIGMSGIADSRKLCPPCVVSRDAWTEGGEKLNLHCLHFRDAERK